MSPQRKPVPGGEMPFALRCIDMEDGGTKCQALRNAHPKDGGRFECYNQRRSNDKCSGRRFLYPRKWAKSFKGPDGKPAFHFHQGIDIFAPSGTNILSVTHGTVVQIQEWNGESSGYGHVVAVYTPDPSGGPGITYWYAHCQEILVSKGDEVQEKQPIATVGNSGNAGDPHLHFETLRGKITRRIGGYADERKLGDKGDLLRLDPIDVLESLGPWGMQKVFDPSGYEINAATALDVHRHVESSPHGGYFPLGANNHWHGGVHLRMPRGSTLHAPFDATIVAARLDPDPTHANQPDGSANFILLRHEVPDSYYQLFQGKRPHEIGPSKSPTAATKERAVGHRSHCANQKADVIAVKHRLHAKGFFDPADPSALDDPATDEALEAAISAFQKDEVDDIKPDGVVDIPGKTWTALHDGTPPVEPTVDPPTSPKPAAVDPKRVLYSLLMHLQPASIDAAMAEDFPWLTRVKLAPTPGEPDPSEEAALRAKQEREEDLAEAEHTLRGAVGAPNGDGVPAENFPDDVLWVHQRLLRFDLHHGPPSSTCDQALIAAIRTLQNEHHPSFQKEGNGDGRVDTDGGTVTLLRTTHEDLLARSKSSTKTPTVDPIFLHRTTVRDEHGLAEVVTGLGVKVRSGEPLWRSGQAQGYAADGSLVMLDQFHWELFSEHLLVTDWLTPIEDADADLQANLPTHLMSHFEAGSPQPDQDGVLSLDEVRTLYRDGHGEFLRRTPCRFVSHWGLDVEAAVKRLEEMHYDTEGLRERLRPFMWWDQAADVLPGTRHVWHYNPIELLADYAKHLEAMKPPGELDPATHPTLVVRVRYDDLQPMPNVQVMLLLGTEILRMEKTNADGKATFQGVAVGEYGVLACDTDTSPVPVAMRPSETTELEIVTAIPGPPLPRGSLHVTVRKHSGYRAEGIEVWLEHAQTGPVTNDYTDDDGEVSFQNIPYGDYVITAGDAGPAPVTLAKKDKKVPVIMLPPPVRSLYVRVTIDGKLAPHQRVEILEVDVPRVLTNDEGTATFELREGRYTARVGSVTEKVRVKGTDVEANTFTLELSSKVAPPPETGTLYAWVHEGGTPRANQPVMVFSPDGRWLDFKWTNDEGCASFDLPAEPVIVGSGSARESTTVLAQDFTSVILTLSE